jgi:hypothetical protein
MAHPPHLGLRAHFRNYFVKHATFSVHIHIHELANIPFVSGDFACRWRVKGARALSSALGRSDSTSGKSARSDGTASASGSASFQGESKRARGGRTQTVDADIEVQVQPPSPPLDPTVTQGSVSTTVSINESGWSSPSESSDGKAGGAGLLQAGGSSHDHGSDTEDGQPRGSTATLTSSAKHGHPLHGLVPGRGTTETVEIVDHTVRWDELVELAAHMGIAKDTKALLPSELKLMVEQVCFMLVGFVMLRQLTVLD